MNQQDECGEQDLKLSHATESQAFEGRGGPLGDSESPPKDEAGAKADAKPHACAESAPPDMPSGLVERLSRFVAVTVQVRGLIDTLGPVERGRTMRVLNKHYAAELAALPPLARPTTPAEEALGRALVDSVLSAGVVEGVSRPADGPAAPEAVVELKAPPGGIDAAKFEEIQRENARLIFEATRVPAELLEQKVRASEKRCRCGLSKEPCSVCEVR